MKLKLKNGLTFSLNSEDANKLALQLAIKTDKQFIIVSGQLINKYEIEGLFSDEVVEASLKLKGGQWQCKRGLWHGRFETRCDCSPFNESKPMFSIDKCKDIINIKAPTQPLLD